MPFAASMPCSATKMFIIIWIAATDVKTHFFGPLTKHQSTPIVCPNISVPSKACLAASASSNNAYSIKA